MPANVTEIASATSLAMLHPLLMAMNAEHRAEPRPVASLPAPVLWFEHGRVLLCATPLTAAGMVRPAMVAAAQARGCDVVVVRHGLWPETLDDVEYDVLLGRTEPSVLLAARCLYRHVDGSLWLVPNTPAGGPFIRLNVNGLVSVERPPYAGLDERGDGVARAARETVLSLRRQRRR